MKYSSIYLHVGILIVVFTAEEQVHTLTTDPYEMLSALKSEHLQHSVCQETRPPKKGQF